jgi:hypothetical protein
VQRVKKEGCNGDSERDERVVPVPPNAGARLGLIVLRVLRRHAVMIAYAVAISRRDSFVRVTAAVG